jgi:dTDP-4-amino-4,6-dideoxygalactose transaminase
MYVSKPSVPRREAFDGLLDGIWERSILTNSGPLHEELELALARHLDVEHLVLFANGTIAMMAALRSIGAVGEVITTPFSFVASANALTWCGLRPVFADIDPISLNLDPAKIEAAISPRTSAIMPVHCYGHPCETEAIDEIARRHGLTVMYDAAHAFGVSDSSGSILRNGDISAISFHATKVFHTVEGGAVVCRSAEMKARLASLRNFELEDEFTVAEAGFNGKMSELHAAVGLCLLPQVDDQIDRRAAAACRYRRNLAGLPGIRVIGRTHEIRENHSFFPILIGPGCPSTRDAVYAHLRTRGIFARRYFHPLISDFAAYRDVPSADPAALPVAQRAAREVLCLPMSSGMSSDDVDRVCVAVEECIQTVHA